MLINSALIHIEFCSKNLSQPNIIYFLFFFVLNNMQNKYVLGILKIM